jgi:hypothetical protein
MVSCSTYLAGHPLIIGSFDGKDAENQEVVAPGPSGKQGADIV